MQSLQRTVVGPSDEVLVDRTPGRQVLRNRAPLTSGAEDVHHPIRHLADIDRAPVAATLGRRNQRPDLAPLHRGQIALVAQMPHSGIGSHWSTPQHPPNSGKGGENDNGFNEFKRGSLTGSKDSICSRTDKERCYNEIVYNIVFNFVLSCGIVRFRYLNDLAAAVA